MPRTRKPALEPSHGDVDAALDALDADELREIVRTMLLELDDRAHARATSALIHRAARSGSGWAPATPSGGQVAEVVAFATAARRAGYAEPAHVDERLRRGNAAFLRKDYAAAHQIFGALLPPIADVEIDLGQDELIDEVLGTDPSDCSMQYVVSAYMLADPEQRARAVRAAIDHVLGISNFWEPIQQLEAAAVEPLPELAAFLPAWRQIIETEVADERRDDRETSAKRWLREVVQRMDGVAGLASFARSTKHSSDLRAWCQDLVRARDWNAALPAFEEAAELADAAYSRGEFLDGAALAAQVLGTTDLSPWLERAWRADPGMLRLRRWLAATPSGTPIRARAAQALEACPNQAHRQRAFLHVLQGEVEPAAELLAAASGLGWSQGEHPGPLLFPLFHTLLAGPGVAPASWPDESLAIDELELLSAPRDEPRLAAPDVGEILRRARIDGVVDPTGRRAMLAAMRKATEKRLSGVTEEKRRRHYGHAASLVAVCFACDPSPATLRWVESIRTEYRRFPALRAELDRHMGKA